MATKKRYNQRDNNIKNEYKRLVRNTKAKLKRVKDDYGIDLSYEIEIPSYEEAVQDFDEFTDNMIGFTQTDPNYKFARNDKGVVYTLAELQAGLEFTKQAQENAQDFIDRFKEKEYQISGKDAGYTVGDRMIMYDKENVAGISVPDEFDINAFESRSRLIGKLETLEEKADGVFFDRSMRTMKENFMKSLKGSFNSEADDVVEMIDIMPEDDFFELFVQSAEFTFEDYASDGSIDGTAEQAERLRGYLQSYFKGDIDMTLKAFGSLTGGSDYDKAMSPNKRFVRDVRKRQGRK